MLLLIISYLLLVFVIPITLSLVVSFRALPKGGRCAQCGAETIRIRARVLDAVTRSRVGVILHRRWCLSCGWEGVTRLARERPLGRPGLTIGRAGGRMIAETAATGATTTSHGGGRTATQTLDVRSVTVDGRPFRVMLQCWNTTGLFYGRLVFIGPSGRLWLDAIEAFSGANQKEVLCQALSLPDGLLENRLRRLVSDP